MNIFEEIFSGRELTIKFKGPANYTAILDKYNLNIKIEYAIISNLVYHDIIILDSGNFETNERHWILNSKKNYKDVNKYDIIFYNKIFNDLKPILREIRLSQLI